MPDEVLPQFVRVPPGEFVMGADDGEEDERPAHRVHLDAYYMSVHCITNEQYAEFVRVTGHSSPAVHDLPVFVTLAHESTFRELAADYAWRGVDPPRDRSRHPVTLVGYHDAVAYCTWLSRRIGRPCAIADRGRVGARRAWRPRAAPLPVGR